MTVRYLQEAGRGKSRAYNTGMAGALGSIYLFTDDDVRVPEQWIEVMCRPIAAGATDATTGEIRIAPGLLTPWMTDSHRSALMEIADLSEQHARQPFLIGANMACSAEAAARIEGFCEALGPGMLGNMEDTLFYLQLIEAGCRIGFVAGHPVEHHFDPCRRERTVQLRQAKALGRSTAWVMHHWAHEAIRWRRIRLVINGWRMLRDRAVYRLQGSIGFNPRENVHAQRFWTYVEFGKLIGTPREYPKRGVCRQDNHSKVEGEATQARRCYA
jgi:GT2 family glycosyltransferase